MVDEGLHIYSLAEPRGGGGGGVIKAFIYILWLSQGGGGDKGLHIYSLAEPRGGGG